MHAVAAVVGRLGLLACFHAVKYGAVEENGFLAPADVGALFLALHVPVIVVALPSLVDLFLCCFPSLQISLDPAHHSMGTYLSGPQPYVAGSWLVTVW